MVMRAPDFSLTNTGGLIGVIRRAYVAGMADFKLPDIVYPMSIDTVGIVMAEGYEISMHCYGCGRKGVRLNLVQIARRHGMSYGSMESDLKKVVSCIECKAAGRPKKNIGFTLHAPTNPHSRWPRERKVPNWTIASKADAG